MANEELAQQQAEPTEVVEPHGEETDWKAEARKWEERARENRGAAEELQRLKEAQMTEAEKLAKRAADAEAALAQMTQAKEHAEAVASISASSGVPAGFLAFCSTAEDMESFAKLWAEHHAQAQPEPAHAGVKAPERRIIPNGTAKVANKDVFAAMFNK